MTVTAFAMSTRHLSLGSECPAREEGKLRLYGMHYCPFVQRVKMVLNVKGVPYDVVNVNLKHKPEWLYKLHPEGKVPALDTGDQIIIDSLSIAEFLEEKFPSPPLYPTDPACRAHDKELISRFGEVVSAISNAFHDKENKSLETFMKNAYVVLEEFEVELANRKTPFFGGEQPGMLDLMIWPWSERSKLPGILKNEEFKFPKEKFPNLVIWRVAMQQNEAVRDTIIDLETHIKFLKGYLGDSENPKFDDL